jgi:uncharacterized membrane protein YhhN
MWIAICLICFVHIWSIDRKNRTIFYLTKATPILMMAYLVLSFEGHSNQTYVLLIGAGLLLSSIGDLFLMHPKDAFIQGLGAFFFAHIVYSMAFFNAVSSFSYTTLSLLLAIGVIVYLFLLPTLGEMKYPVAVYSLAILSMAWGAIELWSTSPYISAAYGALGAIVFIASDLVLAIDRFRSSSAFSRHVIMITYYTAQALLTLSVLS